MERGVWNGDTVGMRIYIGQRGVIWECGYGSKGCLEVSVHTNSTVCLSLVLPVQVWSGYGGRCTSL